MTLIEASQWAIIVGSIAIFGVAIQVFLGYKQLKSDHERSRREKAVDLLRDWSNTVKAEQTWARKLVEKFDSEQCRALWNQEIFEIPEKQENHLAQFFDVDKNQKTHGVIKLTEKQVVTLRWYVISYMNLMESILVAWQYSIVSREIIEHQFSFLFSPEKGHSALHTLRVAAGGEKSYPATEIFTNHLERKRRKSLSERSEIA